MKTGLEITESCPAATESIHNWLAAELIKECANNKAIPPDFIDYLLDVGVPIGRVMNVIDTNPRLLFDAFDSKGIFISTESGRLGSECSISIGEDTIKLLSFKTRTEAESNAIGAAFLELEKILIAEVIK